MKVFKEVYDLIQQIPKGKVTTYQQIAIILNISPRVVGFALHANKDPINIPCHRVVKKDGRLAKGYAFGGADKQRKKLEKEGVRFGDLENIDLNQYLFNFKTND